MSRTGLLLMALLACLIGPTIVRAAPLDDQIAAFNASASQTEAQVIALLEQGLTEGRSAQAMAAVQSWLNRSSPVTAAGHYAAGRASENAGLWLAAVGYYQRLLQMPQLDAKLAGPAAQFAYRLLLGPIADPDAAYLFMRKNGDRVRAMGQASRYDNWFIAQAQQRRDLIALCDRLKAILDDKAVKPEDWAEQLDAVCLQFEAFAKEDADAYEAALRLAAAPRIPPIIGARLRWAATVMPYNFKLDELRLANAPAAPGLTDAPLAAATELLKLDPDRSITIAAGWGTAYDGGGSDNCAKRFNIDGPRKLDQLLAVVERMSPTRRDDLLAYPIAQGRVSFDLPKVRPLVRKYPDMLNRLDVADVRLIDAKSMTVEEAKELAPLLARNPHADAAVIRAIGSSGSVEFEPIAKALFAAEAWRFAQTKPALDRVWQIASAKSEVYKQVAKQYPTLGARFDEMSKQIDPKASSAQRLAAFDALYKDLLAQVPTIPGAVVLWGELFAKAPDTDNIEMIKRLTADLSGDRELLLRRALDQVSFGKQNAGRLPWQAWVHENHFRYHRDPTRAAAKELIAHVQQLLEKQLQAGAINETIFGMWLQSVDFGDAKARTLMQSIAASGAYAKLDRAYRQTAMSDRYFGRFAMTSAQLMSESHFVSEPLLSLGVEASASAIGAAFEAALNRAQAAAGPVVILGVDRVAQMKSWDDKVLSGVLSLLRDQSPIGEYPTRRGYEPLLQRLCKELTARKRWGEIESYAAGLWHVAGATEDARQYWGAASIIAMSEAAMDAGAQSVALSLARAGVASGAARAMAGRSDGEQPALLARLKRVVGNTSLAIGLIDIPVDVRDPAYPIYKSQSEFAVGNTDAAWALYDKNAQQIEPILRQLTVPYCLWLVESNLQTRQPERAEKLTRLLTVWSREVPGTFSAQQEAELKIAYADAAFQQGSLQTAKAWYRRVADAAEYKGSAIAYKAMLRSVDVDRAAKDYTSALAELDKLLLIRDEQLRQRVHYARAQVLFDQENYAEAFSELSIVLRRDPGHADALILLGKAQLEMRKLVDASEIELGVSRDQKVIVPGELIKINLNDPALNISGVGADIEVEVWTASGDRERVKLHQVGDDKTKFRAEVPTVLGPRQPGDKTLQVLGRDEIRYGYSKRFREKMTDLPPDPDVVIGVASDAHLAATAGAFAQRQGERKLDLAEVGVSTAQQALGVRKVRPGNPVYIRLTDLDQSRTDKVDQVVVSLEASSGDSIARLVLEETGPHTGEFQASVPTSRAQALAYASESAPGREPNMVISRQQYPGWSGEVGSRASVKYFNIDLNDNVSLDRMTILCSDPGQAPSRFVLQTSMNGQQWETRSRFPNDPSPWDGRPQITAFPTFGAKVLAISELTDRTVPQDWREKMDILSARSDVAYNAMAVKDITNLDLDLPSGGHPGYSVLMRYRAIFYQPAAAMRTFKLEGFDGKPTIFLIDGKPSEADDPMTIEREVGVGVHEIEIWRHESRADLVKRKPRLLCDVQGAGELQPCPQSMFDPASFPEAVRSSIAQATTIVRSDKDPNQIDVAFGAQTQARLIRLAIVDNQGAAPAIQRITLTDRSGVERLPVAVDYQQLRANNQLEVVPGDSISVRYEDDQSMTPNRTIQQARLSVAFNDASISASFLNYVTTEEGRELVLEPIRRFNIDDAVGIVINDPDMDQSPEPDRVEFTVQASSGQAIRLVALETGPQTGEFLGRIFPVLEAPKRESEIQIQPGDTLTARYRDDENLDPGIPAYRSVVIEHARYAQPELAVYDMDSQPLAVSPEGSKNKAIDDDRGPEVIAPRRSLSYQYPTATGGGEASVQAIIGSTLRFDVIVPHLALAGSSRIAAYVQTESGRKAQASGGVEAADGPFDLRVPGTMLIEAVPSRSAEVETPAGYRLGFGATPPQSHRPLDEGRFAFAVPIVLGDVPTRSYATAEAQSLPPSQLPEALAVRPGDKVYIGFAWVDAEGKAQWLTAEVQLEAHEFLDVMDSRYRLDVREVFVGEKLHLRLIAPQQDTGPDRNVAKVSLKAQSGAAAVLELRETEAHSGVFKGLFTVSYADKPIEGALPSVDLYGLPVKYGDQIALSVGASSEDAAAAINVMVNKGADGLIEPFSKRYGEDAVAIGTTFTLAECYFELAKHHRLMEQESLARREMGQAQKLLAEAVAAHHDPSMQAQAEYLLGNLAQEYADLSKNDAARTQMYQDALARFTKIPLDYPDTDFAPKAQFKKALVYEKLGEVDIAVEEYVKLAYKYPEHELIPSVMSRLGAYFQAKGNEYKTKAEALEQAKDDTAAQGEAIGLRDQATREYLNAARVFEKLQARFPTNELAGLAGLRSAQNYMRAGDYATAVSGFQKVVDQEEYDDKTVRSQALFWMGISHERLEDLTKAYENYRRVTFDFPDSVWAKQARGRLADPAFARIIEIEKQERERMLEALKEQQKKR